MSDHGVYGDEMARKRFSDREVEMLLSGELPENEEMARLAALLHEIHSSHVHVPTEAAISLFASRASQIVTEPLPEAAPSPSPRRVSTVISSRRFAATAAGIVLVLGMSGVAAASDSSAPGHPLYGVDRTLETIGVGAGGATERIAESQVLLDRGEVAAAVAHAAEAMTGHASDGDESTTQDEASEELLGLADDLAETEGEPGEVRDAVSAMLAEMAAMIESDDVDGAEFGRRVSELARSLHGAGGNGTSTTDSRPGDGGEDHQGGQGPPDDVPFGPPQNPGPGDNDSGGPSGGNGPPGGTNPTGGGGQPGGDDPPGGGGKSGGTGPPGGQGQSDGNGPPGGNGSPGRGGPP